MIKYRPHARLLAEAMEGYKEFNSIDKMFEYIVNEHSTWGNLNVEDLSIGENLMDDDRIGWKNVRHVLTNRYGSENYISLYGRPQCIGWCSLD